MLQQLRLRADFRRTYVFYPAYTRFARVARYSALGKYKGAFAFLRIWYGMVELGWVGMGWNRLEVWILPIDYVY